MEGGQEDGGNDGGIAGGEKAMVVVVAGVRVGAKVRVRSGRGEGDAGEDVEDLEDLEVDMLLAEIEFIHVPRPRLERSVSVSCVAFGRGKLSARTHARCGVLCPSVSLSVSLRVCKSKSQFDPVRDALEAVGGEPRGRKSPRSIQGRKMRSGEDVTTCVGGRRNWLWW